MATQRHTIVAMTMATMVAAIMVEVLSLSVVAITITTTMVAITMVDMTGATGTKECDPDSNAFVPLYRQSTANRLCLRIAVQHYALWKQELRAPGIRPLCTVPLEQPIHVVRRRYGPLLPMRTPFPLTSSIPRAGSFASSSLVSCTRSLRRRHPTQTKCNIMPSAR